MKVIAYILAFVTLFAGVLAVEVQKSFIVSYPNDTPDSVMQDAKNTITAAGGVITHEYQLIKGFAAQAGEKILEQVQAMGTKYNALVEEDQSVSINS